MSWLLETPAVSYLQSQGKVWQPTSLLLQNHHHPCSLAGSMQIRLILSTLSLLGLLTIQHGLRMGLQEELARRTCRISCAEHSFFTTLQLPSHSIQVNSDLPAAWQAERRSDTESTRNPRPLGNPAWALKISWF